MRGRTEIVCLGSAPAVVARVEQAVDDGWPSPRAPTVATVDPSDLRPESGGWGAVTAKDAPFDDACAIVVTPTVLDDETVRPLFDILSGHAPLIGVVDEAEPAAFRTAFRMGMDDVVGPAQDGVGPTQDGDRGDNDPLPDRLGAVVDVHRTRLTDSDVSELRRLLLDSATTLMSAAPDELTTKIEWVLQTVGDRSMLGDITVYLDEDDEFAPSHHWSRGETVPESRSLTEFPDHERLAGFENVVRSPADSERETGSYSNEAERESEEARSKATVHIPIVTEWELVGVARFEAETSRREWTDQEVSLYRTLGDMIAHALARDERQQALKRQAEQLEQFSSVVSHDLRNPINVIAGYTDLAADDLRERHYRAITNSVNRMETLIDDLLMLAKEGDLIGETEPVQVERVAEKAWQAIRAPNATLTIAEDIGRVEADPSRFRQALENLFRNSIDHGGSVVNIEVGPATSDGSVTGFYVADDGPGIPDEHRESIFESGFTTENSSGIGLAIVSRIADGHGWTVDVHNDDGATFEFTLETARAVSA